MNYLISQNFQNKKLIWFLDKAISKNLDISRIKKECLTDEWFNKNYTTIEKTKLNLICPIHGEYQQTISLFLNSRQCKKCSNARNSKKRVLTSDKIKNKLKKLSKENLFKKIKILNLKEAIKNYKNKNQKIKVKCIRSGVIFERSWDSLFKKLIPKSCLDKRNTFDEFLKLFIQKGFNKKFWIKFNKEWWYKNYKNGTTHNLKLKCKNCKKEIYKSWSDLLILETGCSYCAPNTFLSYEKFLKKAKEIHGDTYDYSLITEEWWKENHTRTQETTIPIICKIHGLFYQKVFDHLAGSGCQKCSESHGERKIRLWLEENNINYIKEYSFPDLISEDTKKSLRFDFYLPELNTVIEFDGLQHFEPVELFGGEEAYNKLKKNDNLKNNFCNKNNIKLIRINYKQENEIEKILAKEIINGNMQ